MRLKDSAIILGIFSASLLCMGEPEFQITTDKKDAVYQAGEKIRYTISLRENGKQLPEKNVMYELRVDGLNPKRTQVKTTENPIVVETSLDHPGWSYCQAWYIDDKGAIIRNQKNQSISKNIGAVVEPYKIQFPAEPADFDSFWNHCKQELAKVPMKAALTKSDVWERDLGRVECYDIKIECAGGKPVSGYFLLPCNAKPKSLPAYLTLHGAGVRSANKSFGAGRTALVLDVNAHGIENGKDASYYNNLAKGELKDYTLIGIGDKNQYYMKNMYLRALRALEYLKSRPEWNGETLIVEGSSQGGAQALAVAGLDPQVTLCIASYPALCDQLGETMKPPRLPGWPAIVRTDKNGTVKNPAAAACLPYFDAVNFAKRIKADLYISIGYTDMTTPPNGIFAAFNNAASAKSKHLSLHPDQGHGARNEAGIKARETNLTKHLYKK